MHTVVESTLQSRALPSIPNLSVNTDRLQDVLAGDPRLRRSGGRLPQTLAIVMSDSPNPFAKFIDLEGVWSKSETPSLKAVFDNLRNYPILALFALIAKEISLLQLSLAIQMHYVLLVFLMFFSLATFIQTALLLTALVMGFVIGFLPKRGWIKNEYVQTLFAMVFVGFFFFSFCLAMAISTVIDKVKLNG